MGRVEGRGRGRGMGRGEGRGERGEGRKGERPARITYPIKTVSFLMICF